MATARIYCDVISGKEALFEIVLADRREKVTLPLASVPGEMQWKLHRGFTCFVDVDTDLKLSNWRLVDFT